MSIQQNNIVNRKGGVDSSLYQMCLKLRGRTSRVPEFEPWLEEMEAEEQEEDADTDPVTSMWNMLRRGQPLLTIYNSTNPPNKLELETSKLSVDKFGKKATFMFLQACMAELKIPPTEVFIVTDLYGTDTTGFVKVLRVVNRVLDVAEERGYLHDDNGEAFGLKDSKPKSHAENVINEIVTTERDYVQHLETLQQFQSYIQQANVLPGDTIHSIFMNLNQLLDFQRRFLIRVEQQNSLDPTLQNWGQLFHMYQEQFRVYEPFIANQTRCNDTVSREWEKVRSAHLPPEFQGMVETQSVLLGFLLKPFQRLVKYPMLLDSLVKKGEYDAERIEDLRQGIKATNDILESANEAVAREARVAASHDLMASVEDWKGHQLSDFGELLIFGGQTVLKGDGAKEVEREYKIYLFEKILLCCKDINPNKAKNKLSGKSVPKGKQRLQLKGRIWISNITDIVTYNKNQAYYLHVYWRSDPAIENFVVRFINIEARDKWTRFLQKQRHGNNRKSPAGSTASRSTNNELYSLAGTTINNPYEEDDDDDEVHYTPGSTSMSSNGGMTSSRNASNTSLRARSATGGSGGPMHASQMPPPRFPLPDAMGGNNLRLHTQGVTTPGDQGMNSYFSPVEGSPSSSMRMSQISQTSASNFPLPPSGLPSASHHRQQPSNTNNSWASESNSKHMTAPAPARNYPDENAYARQQRPSLPANASYQYPPLASRSRSASSPHVQPPASDRRSGGAHIRTPNDDEPMPPLPTHMQQLRNPINRSQSNSPTDVYRNARNHQQPPPLSRNPQTFPNAHYGDPRYAQNGNGNRLKSPVPPAGQPDGVQLPSQLRVKIAFHPYPSHVTIVVPNIIRYQTLIDRVDSKMERITSSSIVKNTARLKYTDSDGDLITIGNDEDIKDAIQEWMEANEAALRQQVMPDFELHWVEIGQQR